MNPTTLRTIAVLGPESSGKTTLCRALAKTLNCSWVAEYARDYHPETQGVYHAFDLVHILHEQQARIAQGIAHAHAAQQPFLILDTEAIVLHVWAQHTLGTVSEDFQNALTAPIFDDYLLLSPDLPWVQDELRNAPLLSQRQAIFAQYEALLKNHQRRYHTVDGMGETRHANALQALGLVR